MSAVPVLLPPRQLQEKRERQEPDVKALGNGHTLPRQSAIVLFSYRAVRRSPGTSEDTGPEERRNMLKVTQLTWEEPPLELWAPGLRGRSCPFLPLFH